MQKILFEINKGKVAITVKGVKGKSCTDVTKNVETALGTVKSQRKTGEYYEKATGPEVKLTR